MIKLLVVLFLLWVFVAAAKEAKDEPTTPATVPPTILDHAGR